MNSTLVIPIGMTRITFGVVWRLARSAKRWASALLLTFAFASNGVAAPDMPALMLLEGTLTTSLNSGAAKPQDSDRILAFSLADRQLVGAGNVGSGHYVLALSRTASFNGSSMVLEIQQGRRRYALLLAEDGPPRPAIIQFFGKTLPERTLLNLRIGEQTAELKGPEAEDPRAQRLSMRTDLPCSGDADVNRDGKCDDADFKILRLYGGGITRTVGKP